MKLMKKGKESLTACMAALILQLEKEGRPGTAHVYRSTLRRSTLRRVLDFTGGVPLSFCEVTPLWLKSFQNYLQNRFAMGHSSVKVTETYFKRHTDECIGQMNREILSQVFCA